MGAQVRKRDRPRRICRCGPSACITLGELIDRCGDCPRQEIRTKYHGRFAPHAAPLCHVHLCNPANQRCAAYRDQRITNGTAGATVVKELNTLARVIDIAASEWGYFVAVNPLKQTRHPPIARGRERRLSTDEETALLQACDRSRAPMLKGIVILALEAGMRLGELLALNLDHPGPCQAHRAPWRREKRRVAPFQFQS
jgi:integrase